jgi:hypothetical protein
MLVTKSISASLFGKVRQGLQEIFASPHNRLINAWDLETCYFTCAVDNFRLMNNAGLSPASAMNEFELVAVGSIEESTHHQIMQAHSYRHCNRNVHLYMLHLLPDEYMSSFFFLHWPVFHLYMQKEPYIIYVTIRQRQQAASNVFPHCKYVS